MGGILGTALLVCMAALFYLFGRWKKLRLQFPKATGQGQSVTETNKRRPQVSEIETEDNRILSGRLQHPKDWITTSGRLQPLV